MATTRGGDGAGSAKSLEEGERPLRPAPLAGASSGSSIWPKGVRQADDDVPGAEEEDVATRVVNGEEMQAHLGLSDPGAAEPEDVSTRVVSGHEMQAHLEEPLSAMPVEAEDDEDCATRVMHSSTAEHWAEAARAEEAEPLTRVERGRDTVTQSASARDQALEAAEALQEPIEQTFILDEGMLEEIDEASAGVTTHAGATTRAVAQAPSPSAEDDGPVVPGEDPVDKEHRYLGRNFGGFRVVRGVARGGMASVFLARKEAMGGFTQHAAIKVVHPQYADQQDFISMFLDEARIAARIHHPNICRVLDFGTAEGTFYLALEYVNGETWGRVLSAMLRKQHGVNSLPALAAYVVAQACEGLHAAHTAVNELGEPLHIVHRDTSPDSLLVGFDGTVRVLDFGVAHARARLTETRAGVVKGRLGYMAPEQARGDGVTAKADIWSLGVVLREALEQRRLFRRESEVDTIMAVTSERLPEWKAHVPPALRAVCERAMARDPSQRYGSAREMALELNRYLRSAAYSAGTPELNGLMELLFAARRKERQAWLTQPVPRALPTGSFQTHEGTLAPHAPTLKLAAVTTPRAHGDKAGWLAFAAAFAALLVVGSMWVSRLTSRRAPPTAVSTVSGRASANVPLAERAALPRQAAAQPAREVPAPAAAPVVKPKVEAEGADKARETPAAAPSSKAAEEPDRPARAKPQRARRAPPGTVTVAYNGGWAEVYVRGRKLGTTPGRFEVPSGSVVVTLKPFGEPPLLRRRIQVEPGGVTKLRVDR